MTEPLRFTVRASPRRAVMRAQSHRAVMRTDPRTRVIVAATPGRQGIQGLPGEGVPVFGGLLFGVQDSVNTTFDTTDDYRPGSLALYRNGLREDNGNYDEVPPGGIIIHDPPDPLDAIRVDYLLA